MSALERPCRLLLRAYPAEYRQDRGEEIIGTLLEVTPEGRAWPLARDVRSLITGGLRARAALNQQRTTATNLRVAVFSGAASSLVCTAASDASFAVFTFTHRHGAWRLTEWPLLLTGILIVAAVALSWLCGRKAVRLGGTFAAAVALFLGPAIAGALGWSAFFASLPMLACLAVLALLAGRAERPGGRWFWPAAPVVALVPVSYVAPGVGSLPALGLLEALGLVSLLWIVVDARPAIAMSVFVLALWLALGFVYLSTGGYVTAATPLLLVIAVAPLAAWQLRRQSARGTAPDKVN